MKEKITDRQPRDMYTIALYNCFLFYIPPSLRILTSADYCASALTQNTTLPKEGIFPKRVSTEASYLAPIKPPGMKLKPESNRQQTLLVFTTLKIPKSEHKFSSSNTEQLLQVQ